MAVRLPLLLFVDKTRFSINSLVLEARPFLMVAKNKFENNRMQVSIENCHGCVVLQHSSKVGRAIAVVVTDCCSVQMNLSKAHS